MASRSFPSWLRTTVVLVTVVASAVVSHAQSQTQTLPERSKFHLFLLAGQSNMAGRGKVDETASQSDPRVLMLNKAGEWVPAVDPLHFDKPAVVGVGLGRTFAGDYAEHYPDVTVGLIPCAVGGSPISAWQPGGFHKQTKTFPYDDAMTRADVALKSGVLKGILWHQGESDSHQPTADVYAEKLGELVARFRSQLDAPDVPFIAGQLGRFVERPWNEERKKVDAAHRALPDQVANTAFVSSAGLTHKGDRVHFDTASYRELGHRYFQAYQRLVGDDTEAEYEIDLTVAHRGFDGERCWVHARAGIVPVDATHGKTPRVVMTTQPLELSGSDVFYALNELQTEDSGKTWTEPIRHASFARQKGEDGNEVTVCDFVPKWHAATGKLLGTGQTVWYQDNRVMHVRPRSTAYAVYDPGAGEWSDWKRLAMPDELRFQNAGAGSVQRLDLPDGDVLMPIYFKRPEAKQYSTTVCRCTFDGQSLAYLRHGSELTVDVKRGLYEPSITRFGSKYYLTMRNDDHGYVSVSTDGLQYDEVTRWRFDDGTELGNYNTQQHWVTHSEGLFLVYTRRGAENDHVFRHRAPLFIARVDPEELCVIRATERVLVPERGARLGNFGVTDVSAHETWVTVTEWMQPRGVEQHGSDNRIYVAKLRWDRPNRLFSE